MSKGYASSPHPEVTEKQREIVREAIEASGKTYFKSRNLDCERYNNSRLGYILNRMENIEEWSDNNSGASVWVYNAT